MLFKAKLRVTEIRMLPFPDHLEIGCFFPVSSPEGKDGTTGGSGTELGEEMETFLSDAIPPGDHVAGGANADGVGLWEDDTPREICSTVHHGTGPVVASIEADDESGQELETEISRKTIDLEALQKIASCGLPSGRGGTRALVWKLLLGYLPANRDLWDGVLSEKRAAYIQLISELILDPVAA